MNLTQERLMQLLDYNRETGEFRRKVQAGAYDRFPVGSLAGWSNKEGYRYIRLEGRVYRASRLAYLYMTGEWPAEQIDHKNCNVSDDRWKNLRPASQSQNKRNNRLRKDSGTGYKCVVHDKSRDKYRWQVVVDGKRRKSGKRFDTAAEAYADYQARLPSFHGEFANDGGAG